MGNQKEMPFRNVVQALLDVDNPFSPRNLHRFSDLLPEDLELFKSSWNQVPVSRRLNLLEDLENLNDNDTLVCFDDLARFVLEDEDARCRMLALRLLWNCENPQLIKKFIDMMKYDQNVDVRATAATALGQFVYLGEMEEIPETKKALIEEILLATVQGEDDQNVRRPALEAMGFSSREEVPPLIQKAYDSGDKEWLISSLFAMGRSANIRWKKQVLRMLDNHDPKVQFEAIRAAGQLALPDAREPLLDMLQNDEIEDDDNRMAAIWSLSEIGGKDIAETLQVLLENAADDEEEAYIEDAIDNLSFTTEMNALELFDFGIQDEDELDNIIDLSAEDEEDDNGSGKTRRRRHKK